MCTNGPPERGDGAVRTARRAIAVRSARAGGESSLQSSAVRATYTQARHGPPRPRCSRYLKYAQHQRSFPCLHWVTRRCAQG